ncbi:MAG: methyl-accepting chemotaxis protein [Clostridiaceae bacterium]
MKNKGKKGLRQSLYSSFILVAIIITGAMLTFGLLSYFYQTKELTNLGIKALENKANVGIETMKILDEQVKQGKYTLEEAQETFRRIMLNPKSSDGKTREIKSSVDFEDIKAYMYAIDSSGLEVMHPAKEGENIMEFQDAKGKYVAKSIIEEGKNPVNNGVIYFMWQNPGEKEQKPKVNIVRYFEPWDWYINVGCYEEDFYKSAYRLFKISIAIIIVFSILVTILLAFIIGKKILPLEEIIKCMKELSHGNLNSRSLYNKNDEIGYVSQVFNRMADDIGNLINKVKDSFNGLNELSLDLTNSSEELNSSSEGIEDVMGEIAKGSTEQSSELADISTFVENLSESLDIVGKKIHHISSSSTQIKSSADINEESLKKLMQSIEDIKESFDEVIEKVNSFEDNMKKINLITEAIDNIAKETNLLALNASIEAARAGEEGKGFAVVADEIRKLAEESIQSSRNIDEITRNMTKDFDAVVTTTGSATSILENQVETIKDSMVNFENILKEINYILPSISDVNTTIDNTIGEKDELLYKTQVVASISQELSASTEEVAATVEEQNKLVHKLSTMAQDLNKTSEDINKYIDKIITK